MKNADIPWFKIGLGIALEKMSFLFRNLNFRLHFGLNQPKLKNSVFISKWVFKIRKSDIRDKKTGYNKAILLNNIQFLKENLF